ncbi:MAG: Do family serine endopeptidase [Altererythrobacter sp.]|nr:Do family serine endopeptidase [Altererythrobacter sp.]
MRSLHDHAEHELNISREDTKPVRYVYGLTTALLLGGASLSLATGYPAGAQVAQNNDTAMQRITPRAGAPASFADLTEALQPAVVNISTRQTLTIEPNRRFRDGLTQEGGSLGSGFLISADGYIVTNNHVVSPSDQRITLEEITVTLHDGTEYQAELVGTDQQSDLAVLKINRSAPFPFVAFGDSNEARVGDWVIAIGSPFNLGGTVTSGIISNANRAYGRGAYDRYLQTDASINRGNSGGPLFDMQGNVIGVNNAIISPSGGNVGIGFAIPADTAAPIVASLIAGEEIERGYLGVSIQPVSEDMAEAMGIPENRGEIVQLVVEGEAADKGGLREGDIVLRVNGQEVTPDQNLSYLIANIAPGTRIPLEVVRNGEELTLNVTVGKRPSEAELAQQQAEFTDEEGEESNALDEDAEGFIEDNLGISGVSMNERYARELGVSADIEGVAITGVRSNSDAARKGLSRGLIITAANGQSIASLEDLESALREVKQAGRGAVALRIQTTRFQRGPSRSTTVAVRLMEQ